VSALEVYAGAACVIMGLYFLAYASRTTTLLDQDARKLLIDQTKRETQRAINQCGKLGEKHDDQ
jgi:hypothetical protein